MSKSKKRISLRGLILTSLLVLLTLCTNASNSLYDFTVARVNSVDTDGKLYFPAENKPQTQNQNLSST